MNLHNSPQPVKFNFVTAEGESHSPTGSDAWVRLKELRFGVGQKIEGVLVIDTRASVAAADQVKLAGGFQAVVCPR